MYYRVYFCYTGLMKYPSFRRFSSILGVCSALLPTALFAADDRQLVVSIGTEFDLGTIVDRIVTFLSISITTVASAMFVVGAFLIVLSGAKEDYKQQGKDLMIGSIFSVVVVLGAYGIYRTVAFFLQ